MNDDDWMKPPVNYTPYFNWYIRQLERPERRIIEKLDDALWQFEKENFWREICMDLYMVWWDKETKTFRPKTRGEVLGD